jgi:adenylosuccinate lyase
MKGMLILAAGILLGSYLTERTYQPMLISCQEVNERLTEQINIDIVNAIAHIEKIKEKQHKCGQVLTSLGLAYNILGKGEKEDK